MKLLKRLGLEKDIRVNLRLIESADKSKNTEEIFS